MTSSTAVPSGPAVIGRSAAFLAPPDSRNGRELHARFRRAADAAKKKPIVAKKKSKQNQDIFEDEPTATTTPGAVGSTATHLSDEPKQAAKFQGVPIPWQG